MALGKTTASTYSLQKLRNYCIDENNLKLHEQTKMDAFYSAGSRDIPIEDEFIAKKTNCYGGRACRRSQSQEGC